MFQVKMLVLLLIMVVGITAMPHLISDVLVNKSDRFVNDLVVNTLEQLKHDIVQTGFDPYYMDYAFGYYTIPVPLIFSAKGLVTELNVTGLSDYEIRHVDYDHNRLEFDLYLPKVECSIRHAEGAVVIFGSEIKCDGRGKLVLRDVRLAGEMRLSTTAGVSVTNLNLYFSVTSIQSYLHGTIVDYNISERLNRFFEFTVPQTLEEYKGAVNELLSFYLIDSINKFLANG